MEFIEIEKSVRTNDWSMQDLHSHSHYEIYYLYKGHRSYFLSNALYHLTAPCILILPPHAMHKSEGGAFERFNVNVSPDYLDPYQKEVLNEKSLRLLIPSEEQNEEFLRLFEEAAKVDRRQKRGEFIVKALFSYIVVLLGKLENAPANAKAIAENAVPPTVLKIMDHLTANFAARHTLDSIADAFFLSKAALVYNFKKYTGCSPIDFLLNVRLTRAKELLVGTKKTVNEISEACGFSSANYFGLLFKQKENLSPMAYRKYQTTKT